MTIAESLEALSQRIERAEALDAPADALAKLVRMVVRPGPVEDALSGTPLGHPLHPLLVAVPIGAWTSSAAFDLIGDRRAARRLIGIGCLTALPAATAGASDWLATQGAERRVGFVHAVLNDAALAAYGSSWLARRRGRTAKGIALSTLGAALLSAAGWLGGHLAFAQGVGVDTTAFSHVPTEWTDAGAADSAPSEGMVTRLEADGLPLLIARVDGQLRGFLDRCTHRGGPLSEGSVRDGCVECPWHGSRFRLADGAVVAGPATRPQPTVEVRERAGRIEIRRDEPRTLRTNPTGR